MALQIILLSICLFTISGVKSQSDATTAFPELSTEGIVLSCSDSEITVDIPKSLLTDEMAGTNVVFENAEDFTDTYCQGSDEIDDDGVSIIRLTTNLTACGTNMTETDDEEVYTNRVVNNYAGATYTRFYTIDIPITCSYNRSRRVGYKEYQLTDYTIDKTLSEDGQYTFSFELYDDDTYENAFTDYPQRIGLNEELFFAASVLSLDGTVDLSIRSCRATPTSNYDNTNNYDFIVDGCTNDSPDTNLTELAHNRIGVETNTFRFVGDGDFVYIHCNLLVCDARDVDSICNTDCVGATPSPSSRRRRDVSADNLKTKRFTRGPLRIVRAAENSVAHLESNEMSLTNTHEQEVTSAMNPWMLAMAGMATVVMALAAVLVVVLRKVNRIAASTERRGQTEETVSLLKDPEF